MKHIVVIPIYRILIWTEIIKILVDKEHQPFHRLVFIDREGEVVSVAVVVREVFIDVPDSIFDVFVVLLDWFFM